MKQMSSLLWFLFIILLFKTTFATDFSRPRRSLDIFEGLMAPMEHLQNHFREVFLMVLNLKNDSLHIEKFIFFSS